MGLSIHVNQGYNQGERDARSWYLQSTPNAHRSDFTGKAGAVAQSKPIPQLTPEQQERFWSHVAVPYQPSGCWEWTACKSKQGYGKVGLAGKCFKAHRVAYHLLIGLPTHLVCDHLCRNPSCVNPDHIEVVANEENNRRGFGAASLNRRKQNCKCGRVYSFRIDGSRFCATCSSERNRSYRDRVGLAAEHPTRTCLFCRCEFSATHVNHKYCSLPCQRAMYASKAVQS